VTGDNVRIFWCQRETVDTWTLWAWEGSATVGEAATWIRQLLNDDSVFALESQLPWWIEDAASTNPPMPKQVENGLFYDDPLQSTVATAPQPEAFVTAIAAAGYPVAPGLSAMDVAAAEPCDPASTTALESLLNSLTRTSDMTLFGDSLIASACMVPCICTTTTGAWTPGGWAVHQRNLGSRVKCDYENEHSRTVTRTGVWDWWLICPGCATSWTEYRCESAFEDWPAPHTCGGAPQSTTATNFINGRCAGW